MSMTLLWLLTLLNTTAIALLLLRVGGVLERARVAPASRGSPIMTAPGTVDRELFGLPGEPHHLSLVFVTDDCEGCSRALGELEASHLADDPSGILLVDISGRAGEEHDRFRARLPDQFRWMFVTRPETHTLLQKIRIRATPTFLVLRANEIVESGLCEGSWIEALAPGSRSVAGTMAQRCG